MLDRSLDGISFRRHHCLTQHDCIFLQHNPSKIHRRLFRSEPDLNLFIPDELDNKGAFLRTTSRLQTEMSLLVSQRTDYNPARPINHRRSIRHRLVLLIHDHSTDMAQALGITR